MQQKTVLLFGSGHLSNRVKKLLDKSSYTLVHISIESILAKTTSDSFLEQATESIAGIDLDSVVMAYLLDDQDDNNLQLIIALISLDQDIPITAALFNENIAPHLKAAHPNVTILNPAKIAAPFFVAALDEPITRVLRYTPAKHAQEIEPKSDNLIQKLSISFGVLLVIAVIFFHVVEKLSWLNSLYFVVVTTATVGYGDINLLNSIAVSKLFTILLILASTFFIWMIFSFTIDHLLKKRIQLSFGHKKYTTRNHIVMCGLGRLGYFIAEELLKKGEKVIIIERNESSPHIAYFRNLGADVYIGDARLSRVLSDVRIDQAKALVSVINNDSLNLEIGLNGRSFNPNLRLVLRIFDEIMAQKLKEHLDIHLALSTSAIADGKFVELLHDK